MFTKEAKHPKGAIAILTLLGVIVFALLMMTTLATLAASEARMSTADSNTTETFYAAEAGLNQALYNLITDPVPGTYNLTLDDKNITITVGPCEATDPPPCDPYHRKVEARAEDPSGKVRIVSLTASTSSYAGGFDSAVQAAAGGLIMDNGSCVIGNVYSNGDITGPGANNNGCSTNTSCRAPITDKKTIMGKATAALSSTLQGVGSTGDLQAHTLDSSTAGGHAYYQVLDGTVKAFNGAETCTTSGGSYCHPGSSDASPRDLPITMSIISDWKADITTVAPVAYDDCPLDADKYCIYETDRTLGGFIINGDLDIGIDRVVTLNGNLWVTGNIILSNLSEFRIDESLGGESVVVISDQLIDVGNNINITPNSDPRSFILMASALDRKTDGTCNDPQLEDRPAVCAANNSNSIVFAAPEGILHVKNGGCLNASATYKIHLENNSTVTYNPNLSYFTVGGGGGESVGAALGSWREK